MESADESSSPSRKKDIQVRLIDKVSNILRREMEPPGNPRCFVYMQYIVACIYRLPIQTHSVHLKRRN